MSKETTRLRELMDQQGLSVRGLAALANVSPSTIQHLAAGDGSRIRYSSVLAVATVLGVSPNEIGDGCLVLNNGILFSSAKAYADGSHVGCDNPHGAVASAPNEEMCMLDYPFVQCAVKELMYNGGFTVRSLAEAAQVNPSSVQRVVAGRTYMPTRSTLERIAAGLGTTLEELFAYAEDIKLTKGAQTGQRMGVDRIKARSPALAPMILDGDELFVGPAESAKTNDFVIAEKEDGSEVLVRLIRNGDELWGQIDNQNLPGDKIFPIKDVKWKVIGLKRMF